MNAPLSPFFCGVFTIKNLMLIKSLSSGSNWCSCCGDKIGIDEPILIVEMWFDTIKIMRIIKREHLSDFINFGEIVLSLNQYKK